MYMDTVVFAGIGTVLLILAFFGGVGAFVAKDMKKHKEKAGKKAAGGREKTA
ncbi:MULTISPECIES: cytochrome c oxidase subunit CcoM [Marinobacter]|uniref:cytochrome c oxidase subunit CcoM n=1 Tax=Marinobacter TaxID=2742 RepID=UPI001D092C77|nr:cytochrome c oxidase subunit CcoM [Marinobacter xestospongiae]MCG8519749.1 hypothetical protein [Pseudomonadales bacterium]MCK7565770.1 hypothetical protein [Marinobacter xestospongiae]UDL03499.1 hypothetical protein J2887_12125 [Marinobacter sp. CA1]